MAVAVAQRVVAAARKAVVAVVVDGIVAVVERIAAIFVREKAAEITNDSFQWSAGKMPFKTKVNHAIQGKKNFIT